MKIAHTSDLHGNYTILGQVDSPPDLWVITGDFFPNLTRGRRSIEEEFQTRWYSMEAGHIIRLLHGVPVLWVPGNHDYVDLVKLLRRDGVRALEVTPKGCTFGGLRFAGFGEIPFICGEWNREVTLSQLACLTRMTLEMGNPDVLVTHCPPDGILNGLYEGIAPLTSSLAYRPHQVRLHLFGHAHEDGGGQVEHMGIRFVNSAGTVTTIEV